MLTGKIDAGLLNSFEHSFQNAAILEAVGTGVLVTKNARHYQMSAGEHEPVSTDDAQIAIRPLYGKGAPLQPCIGDHPDFLHLKGTDDILYHPITTMFMDIEGSTRLGLHHPLPEVRQIKNAFIQTAIQIIRCFDGHVHRIMGDAVMAYFGGTTCSHDDAIVDGINCAAVLQFFVENVVRPKLKSWGYGDDFGIRIGLDHGTEEKVLWSSYGFPGMDEVTATSFYVDGASKLQHAAGRNQSMFGASIVGTIDFPTELLKVKRVVRNKEEIDDPYLLPNYTLPDGKTHDYRQWQLQAADYLRCTPVGQHSPTFTNTLPTPTVPVSCSVHSAKHLPSEGDYHAASRVLKKDKWLKFKVNLPFMPMLPYKIKCSVEHHGTEAWAVDSVNGAAHSEEYPVQTEHEHRTFEHWESTSYRGLHYLTVDVFTHNKLTYSTRFGVYVE